MNEQARVHGITICSYIHPTLYYGVGCVWVLRYLGTSWNTLSRIQYA